MSIDDEIYEGISQAGDSEYVEVVELMLLGGKFRTVFPVEDEGKDSFGKSYGT